MKLAFIPRRANARNLLSETDSYTSTQVLTELTNTLTRKFKLPLDVALKTVDVTT